MMMRVVLKSWVLLALTVFLAGCGGAAENTQTAGINGGFAPYDNTEEVEAFYRDNPERFVFATPADLPEGLVWEDGAGLPTFADPRAKRGGEVNLRLRSMQQTLRVLGPDANGSLRGPLWDSNNVPLLTLHPWEAGTMPGLASQWASDPQDRRTVYLKLDPDARWSDGRPFTADDVLFTYYFVLSPHLKDPAIANFFDQNLQRVTRYDSHTVAITVVKASLLPVPDIVGWAILAQRDFYREFGPDYVDRYHWRFAPVTGAYVLDELRVKRGRQISFTRLDNWWANNKRFYQHRFNPDRLNFAVVRDDAKAFEVFLKGDLDWHALNRTALWYERADDAPIRNGYIRRAQVYNRIPAGTNGLSLNALDPLLQDPTLRLGVQHAINFDKVNSAFYRGDRRRIRSFSDGYGEYSHPTLKARDFDSELAQVKFAEAGFVERGRDGIFVNAAGQRLSLQLTIDSGDDDPQVASILKEEARRVGLELRIEALDPTASFTKIFEKNYQAALTGWHTGYSLLPTYDWEVRGTDAGQPKNYNSTNINDPRLDELLAEWDGLTDPVRAKEVAHEIQERIHNFAAWVPGLTVDHNRIGHWRWVRTPDFFHLPGDDGLLGSGLFWIDEDLKQQTLAAQREGKTFASEATVYDRWK